MSFRVLTGLFIVLVFTVSAHSQSDTIQRIVPGRHNAAAQQRKPYLILISADGLRADYVKKYNAANLLRLGRQGAVADYMLPSFPSLTFPNHYSIITGFYPAHHGLVDNAFYDAGRKSMFEMHNKEKVTDGSWYGGTPLWVLAEQQKMLTASFYWVGSEAAIQGVRPTYYYTYNDSIPIARRVAIVKEWLALPEDRRPHLITLYFPQIDHESHEFGPNSKETEMAVQLIDKAIGQLASLIEILHLPVNFVVVSDHGMTRVDFNHPIVLPPILFDTTVCTIAIGSTLAHLYLKDKNRIPELVKQLEDSGSDFDVFSGSNTPSSWHYAASDDQFHRLGDLIISARYPKVFKTGNARITPGKHGYDPSMKEMHATFIAWGPRIKRSASPGHFENVDVFPFMAEILGLKNIPPNDGDLRVLKPILIR